MHERDHISISACVTPAVAIAAARYSLFVHLHDDTHACADDAIRRALPIDRSDDRAR